MADTIGSSLSTTAHTGTRYRDALKLSARQNSDFQSHAGNDDAGYSGRNAKIPCPHVGYSMPAEVGLLDVPIQCDFRRNGGG